MRLRSEIIIIKVLLLLLLLRSERQGFSSVLLFNMRKETSFNICFNIS